MYITNLMKVLVEAGITADGITSASLPRVTILGGFSKVDSSELVVPHRKVLTSEAVFYKKLSGLVYSRIVELISQLEADGGAAIANGTQDSSEKNEKKGKKRNEQRKQHSTLVDISSLAQSNNNRTSFLELIINQIRCVN